MAVPSTAMTERGRHDDAGAPLDLTTTLYSLLALHSIN
jgi:hypothetical protein